MTILVTGATGTVGRHVVKQLVQKGERVRAVSRNPARANLPEGVEVVAGDLNAPDTLRGAFVGAKGLFLITSSDEPDGSLETRPKVIELAEQAGVKRVAVLVGYEEGPVEEALKASRMEWTLLKPGEFMANILADWKDSIRQEGVVREAFGDAPSARIHEADIAAVAAAALLEDGHHGQSYILTGPESLTRREAVKVVGERLGREIVFDELTEEQARQNWRDQGYEEGDIEFFVLMGKNPPAIGHTVVPTVEQVLGRPAKTLAEWVDEHKHEFG
ncbi:nucleotide-diphosphate-sugar epimerase [Cohnella xylanilytica]|uniref:NAD(P)H-binding protein n=1 Tax=Cohnella xylanilytica TaxID=557555 RepID=A0A841TVI2_9BACL|nr:NAD(P)H-binding protein [Cohnella xylanilytica]MBB6689991.1 NAD(P)H-binding protein [Cohnella xylanilytica]GIO14066.1 nucleotide-diphosphate-sugar epimerase [Cohnella xylanilytica]